VTVILVSLGVCILVLLAVSVGKVLRAERRKKIMSEPVPPEWEDILTTNIELYRHLPTHLKKQLHNDMKVFLNEKKFEGCGGLEVTEEMRVTIAGEACILLLNRKPTFFPKLDTILIYPHPYMAPGYKNVGRGHYVEEPSMRAGESWTGGALVLAWDYVKYGAQNGEDGQNVVLHEFAHQLDQEDGTADGAPKLDKPSRYREWARIFSNEYHQLQSDVKQHHKTVMDAYGATNPAEFFAVATETFFEKPRQMKKKEPELYEELKEYYKLDPVSWIT
jgi:Mlc titration factor MtfA (ptsG expression regulator)